MSSTPSPNSQPEKITVESIVPAPIEETPYSGVYLALEIKQAELDHQKLLNTELQENIERRGNWGERIFWLLVGWLLSVVGVVLCQGFVYKGFHLDNSVIIAFIATTTVDVLSLGYIVANYLFQKNK